MDSAKQDADVLIVQTTIASAQSKYQIPDSREADTILVGDDTDLLVLLHHADVDSNDIFLSPENTKASKTNLQRSKSSMSKRQATVLSALMAETPVCPEDLEGSVVHSTHICSLQ